MSKRTTVFTPDLLKGITPAPPPPPKVFSSPNVDLGETIFTKPSGFELTTKAFGRKRKKEQVTQTLQR